MFADPQRFPWTMPMIPSYQTEARIYAKHILATKPDAKIAVLYQNDDFGTAWSVSWSSTTGTPEWRLYRSLSQVAKAITGTSWNGHRFFGLKGGQERRFQQTKKRRPEAEPIA